MIIISKNSYISFCFTIIELLIVIAVIAGLSVIAINTFPAASKRARDTTRRSDIKQYQTALEVYYNKNSKYPDVTGNPSTSATCTTLLGLPACPDDPKSSKHYGIISEQSNSRYVIWAELEQSGTTTYAYLCSSGKNGDTTTVPSTTNPCW
jgi:type II secretory pathway pseudopilin PulG